MLTGIFLIAVLLLANLWQLRMRDRRARSPSMNDDARIRRLMELSRENALKRFELEWLKILQRETAKPLDWLMMLRDACHADSRFAAWWLNRDRSVLAAVAGGQSDASELVLSPDGVLLTRANQPVQLAHAAGHYRLDPQRPGRSIETLWAIPCAEGQLLIVSMVPRLSGGTDDLDLLRKLCRMTPDKSTEAGGEQTTRADFQELALVRDMLELRTLADIEFASPQIMLEEFLKRLARLTQFDRGSIFWFAAPSGKPVHAASGGASLSPDVARAWQRFEDQYLVEVGAGEDGAADWFHDPPLRQISGSHPVRSGVAVRMTRQDGQAGCLILSSQTCRVRHDADAELIGWAAQFITHAFEKALAQMQMAERARRDPLTHAANRETFDVELKAMLGGRGGGSLLLLDIDYFKQVNDTYGHVAGDRVLKSVTDVVTASVQQHRNTDRPLVARYGGEEFTILLPGVPAQGAMRIAEQIRAAVERHVLQDADHSIRVTISLGVAASTQSRRYSSEQLLRAADEALYAAKRDGRNRAVLASGEGDVSAQRELTTADGIATANRSQ